MVNRCPFLDGAGFAYSPQALLEVYEAPEDSIPDGFILIGIDQGNAGSDLHIRPRDGAIARFAKGFVPSPTQPLVLENASLDSFLLAAYVRKTLAPSHPLHFSAAFKG